MQISLEIRSAVDNIQYYSQQINRLIRQQINLDVKLAPEADGININAGSVRFDNLGAMGTAANWIDVYCHNILANLESAEKQDKLLYKPESKEEPF